MRHLKTLRIVLTAALLLPLYVVAQMSMGEISINQLKERLEEIDAELSQLAHCSMRSGVGTVGFRSKTHDNARCREWIQIDLGEESMIDRVVLVPTIWRDTESGFRADGFPLEFRVVAGNGDDSSGRELAFFSEQDCLLPRIAPLVINFPVTTASWVRIEASLLTTRAWDDKYILQFSEIIIFSGSENVALHRPVTVSSDSGNATVQRNPQCLVDGFLPYLMNAAKGEKSIAFVSNIGIGACPILTVDLWKPLPLNRIHLHAVDLSDTVPQTSLTSFGVPFFLIIEGANQPDFSDAVHLVEYRRKTLFETGPIIMRRFPEKVCRYIRLTAEEPWINNESDAHVGTQIGFAEIEIFSNGRNVALNCPVKSNFSTQSGRQLPALTDGRNLYGEILPLRIWLEQLGRRHDLETERPAVAEAIRFKYEKQGVVLRWLSWVTVVFVIGIIFAFLIERMLHMRQVANIKERFAADLHDELGANVHAIGLLSDAALASTGSPERLNSILQRNRELTERTGLAVRHCIDLQKASGQFEDLPAEMKKTARRIMNNLEYEISFEGEVFLKNLKPRTQNDLYLFFKECLVNISRHSDATRFNCRMVATGRKITLTVSDNGHGISDSVKNGIPKSLMKRARLLGGRVTAGQSKNGGTLITLSLRTRRWWL